MLIKHKPSLSEADVTPEGIYRQRRLFMKGLIGAGLVLNAPLSVAAEQSDSTEAWKAERLAGAKLNGKYSTDETPASFDDITHHNNFYEFGLGKQDPARLAGEFKTDAWTVTVEGEADKTGKYHLEDLLKPTRFEERIYRLRCVEAWSMVIPWMGIPLATLLKQFEPTSRAKFVEFTTLYDPKQMPGQRSSFGTIDWPYVEGLRIDEAMHPLSFMATGLYGKELPAQNGAPMRLVVPWKYGFKSIKSIVKIRFTEHQPQTSWAKTAPDEYGFYANVNPNVDHPRWSQATERRLPSGLFRPNIIDTQMFNGYGDEVAALYTGMDLRKWF